MAAHQVAQSVPEPFTPPEHWGRWDLPQMEADAVGRDNLYFIRIPDGPVKVGRAIDVKKRMGSLQCGCPWRLELLGVIQNGGYLEGHWHSSFAYAQMVGEWFEWTAEIADAIEGALAGRDVEAIMSAALARSIDEWQAKLAQEEAA